MAKNRRKEENREVRKKHKKWRKNRRKEDDREKQKIQNKTARKQNERRK